ncbi:calmodulin-binding protein-like protein Sha1 [Corynespora cassiicola Philippines]|uniref:Calmodulin-binding protein-like protein Sha1 n=1 Tax=Corynespora cassiicola Philippines TaxID=1448308 RepID=A0A2T2NAZ9_CORCC|nr:calmodulin-binding protein-like protein Sha1 [Corynespora cassiicola Philippines]
MRRFVEATPCPAPNPSFPTSYYDTYSRRSSMYAPNYAPDDTTANIEYTTELQANLAKAKPRRPLRGMRKTANLDPAIDIFEDVAQEEEQQQQQTVVEAKRRSRAPVLPGPVREPKSTIFAHPAQKIHKPAPPARDAQSSKPHRRRVSQLLMDRQPVDTNATEQLHEDVLEKRDLKRQGPKKDPRRRTIYVPSDDTTIMTIHPGQSMHNARNAREKSPDIGLDLVTLSEEEPENLVSAMKKEKKVPRKSLAAPPKRVPLQHNARSLQSVSISSDVYGQGGGKENVPPGLESIASKKAGTHIEINFGKDESKRSAAKAPRVHFTSSKTSDTTSQTRTKSEGSQKRLRSQLSYDGSPAKSIKAKADGTASTTRRANVKPTVSTIKSRITKTDRAALSSSPFHTDRSPPTALRRKRVDKASTNITMMSIVGQPPKPKEKYPVLTEDLARPEMYEDNWLTYQEVAITQLLNSLFESADKDVNAEQSSRDLRKKLLDLYHEPSMPPLHKRLQASLQYGALSIPKDLLAQTLRLKDDVGLRKKFLNLWTKSYDLASLRAAIETIVGRQISAPCRLSTGSTTSDDGSRQFRSERRAIEGFLDTFLIRNEDAVRVKSGVGTIGSIARGDHNGDDFGSQGWSWRRTVLRSLMLVLLLDKAKTTDTLPGCLFQTTSPYKTSIEVLHALSNMLLPSLGDITRPLGHLNYKVEHVQYPLQEYTYNIDNIAVDLRDGVVLTRLVELLLYPPSALIAQQEDTITITMPSGETLTSTFDFSQKDSWVLSQHLRFPSIGRPQKLYNVQVALAALRDVRGIPIQAVGGIKAEDIVDGHREKTLSLLWALVGKCGLGTLVDWRQIAKETERFRELWYNDRDNYSQRNLDSDDDEATTELEGLEYHKRLLLSWSRSIARLHGFRVSNLTTSFANPKVLEAIVDTYLPMTVFSSTQSQTQLSLPAKLKATGCSTSFISLFTSTTPSIPSKDFTLLTLSFLASRLLPLSVTHRAAATIQRAFRARLARAHISRRVHLMRLAHDCAAVVQERNRLVDAATVIQLRWKAILAARHERLESDVRAFQALARGWAIRRWARRITGGKVGGKEKVRRVRGGW